MKQFFITALALSILIAPTRTHAIGSIFAGTIGLAMGYNGVGISNPVSTVLSLGMLSLCVGVVDTVGALYKSPYFPKIDWGSNASLIGLAIGWHFIKCSVMGGALYLGGYSLGQRYSK